MYNNWVDWCYQGPSHGIAFAFAVCKDRANSVPTKNWDIPDHANASEGVLKVSGSQGGARWIEDTFPLPYGAPRSWSDYTADRVDQWSVRLSDDGQIQIFNRSWPPYEYVPVENVDFVEGKDLHGRTGQFATGVLMNGTGVSIVTMSFDRTEGAVLR